MLVANYSSDSEEQENSQPPNIQPLLHTENLAPAVVDNVKDDLIVSKGGNSRELARNVPVNEMVQPALGPANPFVTKEQDSIKNSITGYAEREYVPNFVFNQEYYANTHAIYGKRNFDDNEATTSTDLKRKSQKIKERREDPGDPSILEGDGAYKGPWAGYGSEQSSSPLEYSEYEEVESLDVKSEKDTESDNLGQNELLKEQLATPEVETHRSKEETILHKDRLFDYQNRSYMHVPNDVGINLSEEPGEQTCYIPKKHIFTWKGHTKGISCLRFFPISGHLLLSGSMDNQIKIWEVYHDRSLLRTFQGHSRPIRDLSFSQDGRSFLSTSFDKTIKLWDTELGKCLNCFNSDRLTNCVKFQVDPDKPNEFLAGTADKRILQFDIRSPDIVQAYDHHLGGINSITFLENGKRFVTTSDDSSMRFWEYGTPVPIKFVADIAMHSMPRVALRPNGKSIACQSLDNCIYVYSAYEKYRQNKKKVFKGYSCSGYSLEVGFSPDGMAFIFYYEFLTSFREICF